MTIEEAIHLITTLSACSNGAMYSDWAQAIDMALDALHTQQTPLDRSRWEGCNECENLVISRKMVGIGRRYCPYCGRPLTEEAWAELERRIINES